MTLFLLHGCAILLLIEKQEEIPLNPLNNKHKQSASV